MLPMPDSVLDAGETACGELIMLIFQRMKQLAPGQVLEVVGYDAGATVDIPAWCRQTQNPLIHIVYGADQRSPARFFIRKKE